MTNIHTSFRANIIYGTKGKFFRVEFTKRTTGENRIMNARLGVKKHLKGGDRAYSPISKDLVCVFDMDKLEYRSIPLEAIKKIRFAGTTYIFQEVRNG
jgi:hypothetical protein